jgi:hypothetical protein
MADSQSKSKIWYEVKYYIILFRTLKEAAGLELMSIFQILWGQLENLRVVSKNNNLESPIFMQTGNELASIPFRTFLNQFNNI